MKFAFIVYDGVTLLDFAGVFDPVTRLRSMGFRQDLEYHVCAQRDTVRSYEGLEIRPDRVGNCLRGYDYVFIPGGNGIAALLGDRLFLAWLRDVSPETVLTAVCGGTLLLGAAGFLKGRRATTHPELMKYLGRFAGETAEDRIVDTGPVITARGVTAAIDLGLYLCEKIAGAQVREAIRRQMDYGA